MRIFDWYDSYDKQVENLSKFNLKELYIVVKEHPFRVSDDTKYLQDYQESLDNLMTCFFYQTAERFGGVKSSVGNMLHDFRGAIRWIDPIRLKFLKNNSNTIYYDMIERCIGVIHDYLDTGEINRIYVFGSVGGHITYIWLYNWDKESNKFVKTKIVNNY